MSLRYIKRTRTAVVSITIDKIDLDTIVEQVLDQFETLDAYWIARPIETTVTGAGQVTGPVERDTDGFLYPLLLYPIDQ